MIRALHRRHNVNRQEPTNSSHHFLPYDEPDLYNDYISKEPGYEDRFCTYFPIHCVLGHNLTDTDSLDNVVTKKESSTTNQETNECRPTKIET